MKRFLWILSAALLTIGTAAAQAANDDCASATALALGPNAVSTLGSTPSGILAVGLPPWVDNLTPDTACQDFNGAPDDLHSDVFYTFTPAAGGSYLLSTCNTASYDTKLATYTGTCAALTATACNDDGDGCAGFSSNLFATLNAGTAYTVQLGAFGAGQTGTATLDVSALVDSDGDGFSTLSDCDDTDANIFPGAMEVCGDGIDQNCNGADQPCPPDLTGWLAAVNAGTTPAYMDTVVNIPATVDIGTITSAQGVTYEFIVNGTNAGNSSALMGAKGTGFGNEAALKFEQNFDTMSFGVTQWTIADWTIAPNTENQDLHVVFVADSINGTTEFFVDGVSVGSAPFAPWLTGVVGIGFWYDPGFSVDPLTGAIHGVAVYDGMLSASEIAAHSDAFQSGGIGTNVCMTAPNSNGPGAIMSASGSTSVLANDLVLTATGAASSQPGIMYYGANALLGVPFGEGIRCAGGTTVRLLPPVVSTPGGVLTKNVDNTIGLVTGSLAPIVDTATLTFQAWFRDPACVGATSMLAGDCNDDGTATGFTLSDGLTITFTP